MGRKAALSWRSGHSHSHSEDGPGPVKMCSPLPWGSGEHATSIGSSRCYIPGICWAS